MLDQYSEIFAPAELHILPFDNLDDMELNFKNTSLSKGLIEAIMKLRNCDQGDAEQIYKYFRYKAFSSQDIYDWFLSHINETFLVDKSPTYVMNSKALHTCHELNNDVIFLFDFLKVFIGRCF